MKILFKLNKKRFKLKLNHDLLNFKKKKEKKIYLNSIKSQKSSFKQSYKIVNPSLTQ